MKMNLVYATDNGYLIPTMVSAASAIATASLPNDLTIDILDCGISDSAWNRLETALLHIADCTIVRHRIDMKKYQGMEKYRGIGIANYARFEIPTLLPDEDYCVYADGDTLFCADVFKLQEFYSKDRLQLGHAHGPIYGELFDRYKTLGYAGSEGTESICSGFMVMNLKLARQHNLVNRIFDLYSANKVEGLYDQDILNIVCCGNIGYLPSGWGVFNCEDLSNVEIQCIHFGYGKPWQRCHALHCLRDVERLWFMAAKVLCLLKPSDIGLSSSFYLYRSILAKFYKIAFRIRDEIRCDRAWGKYFLAKDKYDAIASCICRKQ